MTSRRLQDQQMFARMFLKIYEIDPVKCLEAPGFTWKAALKMVQKGGT